MAEKAIKVELSEEDRKILLAQKKILGDVLKPEKKNKGLGALAAELILSGKKTSITGALGSATKQKATESLQEKTKQLKEKFDPLNIINSMFGGGGFGSVMTAAIGKNMGRNEDDIRKFANLDAAEKSTTPENTAPTQMPSGEGGEKSDTMLSEMLKYVIKISEDIRGLKDSSKNQEELFKDQLTLDEKQLNLEEKQLDAANEARYEDMFGKKPTPIGADGKDKKETKEEKGFLASLLGFASALGMLVSGPFKAFAAILAFALSPLRALAKLVGGPLLRGLGAVAAVAAPFAKQIGAKALEYGGKAVEGAKALGGKALAYASEKAPTLVAGARAIGSKAVDIGKNIGAKVAEKAPGIIEGVKTMGGKALEGAKSLGGKAMESVGLKAAATVPGALTPFGEVGAKRAAAAGAEAAGKEGVAALIKKSIAKRVPKAVASAVGKSIPFLGAAIGVGFALSRLMDGDVVGAGLEAVSGIGSFATAIPATVALIAKDIYEDVYGIKPESDPLVGERLGIIQSETEAAVKAEFAGKVGEEEKKGGDKKEGVTTGETKVPGAPELKDGKTGTNSKEVIPGGGQITNPNAPDYNAEYAEFKRESDETKAKAKETSPPIAPTPASIAPTPASQKPMPNWEASIREYETSTPANHLSSQYPGIEDKFRELAKKNKPRSDSFQSIQIHEQMLVTKALGELKNGKVTSPAAEEMKQKSINSEKLAANISQGQGQELKSGPAGIGVNQSAPTSKTDATTDATIAPTQEKRKMPNWEASLREYETATPANHLSSQYPGIEDRFRELAKKSKPRSDSFQSIQNLEQMLVTKALGELKDGKVTSPAAEEMKQRNANSEKLAANQQLATPMLQPAQPTTGEKMTKQSNENTMAKTEAMTGGNSTNTSIVSAPKVTNATNVLNAPINVRNSENTFVRNQDRVHYF
jgi:hypothetical protein